MKQVVTLLFISLLSVSINAQESADKTKYYSSKVQTLDSTIKTLYSVISGEKGVPRDWELFKYLFKSDARLIPSWKEKKEGYKVRFMKPQDYIKSSGKWLVENGFLEKEIHRKIDTFGNITQVFSTYEAFKSDADDTPFMRGINSIQLLYDGNRWWIINIYWTQESNEKPIPLQYLPKQ